MGQPTFDIVREYDAQVIADKKDVPGLGTIEKGVSRKNLSNYFWYLFPESL